MSLSNNLMNGFRWRELIFNTPFFWFPGLEFVLFFPTYLHPKGRGRLQILSVAAHSPVIAEPGRRIAGTRPAS